MGRKIYRARYVGRGKGEFVTTVWRRTKEEAEEDVKMFARSKAGEKVKIITQDYNAYLKKYQNVPNF